MAKPVINEFQEYELTSEEQIVGQCFNDMQVMVLRNELAECQRGLIGVDLLLPAGQQALVRAEFKGKIDLLKGLITTSEDTRKDVIQRNIENTKGN